MQCGVCMERRALTLLCTTCFQIFLISCLTDREAWAGEGQKPSGVLPLQPIPRCFPPLSPYDTVGKIQSSGTHLFADNEIIEVIAEPEKPAVDISLAELITQTRILGFHQAMAHQVSKDPIPAQYRHPPSTLLWYGIKGRKHIYQQAGKKTDVAACAGMLLLDHGKDIPRTFGSNANLGKMEGLIPDLGSYGLSAEIRYIDRGVKKEAMIDSLRKIQNDYGSIILSIDCELYRHAIILDEINTDRGTATIRDPYHGWIIEIFLDALFKSRRIETIVYITSEMA